MADEEWRQIPEFSGYEASSLGRVRSWLNCHRRRMTAPRLLALRKNIRGYLQVEMTRDDGKRIRASVHRVILLAFVGPCPEGHEARHVISNDKTWNAICNLAWGTPEENMSDSTSRSATKSVRGRPACSACTRQRRGSAPRPRRGQEGGRCTGRRTLSKYSLEYLARIAWLARKPAVLHQCRPRRAWLSSAEWNLKSGARLQVFQAMR